jgi:hypothetical protein
LFEIIGLKVLLDEAASGEGGDTAPVCLGSPSFEPPGEEPPDCDCDDVDEDGGEDDDVAKITAVDDVIDTIVDVLDVLDVSAVSIASKSFDCDRCFILSLLVLTSREIGPALLGWLVVDKGVVV